jgi:GTP-binding protein HflX
LTRLYPVSRTAEADERQRCVLVGVDFGEPHFAEHFDELAALAQSAGLDVAARLCARRQTPQAAYLIGTGKLEELRALCDEVRPAVVIFAQPLGPIQQRNVARALDCAVIDRTGLILDIFAQRAQSHEGKLQVELARLQYQSTRLVRQWSHLERQRGGIGVRGGPGERQIELDRRMLAERVKQIKERLAKVQRQRDTQRRARLRAGVLRVSIVGYTNAGKSTLFNRLTRSQGYAADQLFATLDTTTRRLKPSRGGELAISDTVGFVRELPHALVAAFKSTLQEAAHADLLLHVVDVADPQMRQQIAAVDAVLAEIGASDIEIWLVFNKIDRTGLPAGASAEPSPQTAWDAPGPRSFRVSAWTGEGVDALRAALEERAMRVSAARGMSKFGLDGFEPRPGTAPDEPSLPT